MEYFIIYVLTVAITSLAGKDLNLNPEQVEKFKAEVAKVHDFEFTKEQLESALLTGYFSFSAISNLVVFFLVFVLGQFLGHTSTLGMFLAVSLVKILEVLNALICKQLATIKQPPVER